MPSTSPVPTITLNNGVTIPQLGLGTARIKDDAGRKNVREALELGYRLIDTAASYDNEGAVGQGIADSGVDRDEIFVSTKLRGAEQGYHETKKALNSSLTRLGLDHVDLYLIHWPLPRLDKYVESWRAMEELLLQGKTRAIGVSNFLPEHLDRLAENSTIVPAVNQIELHPFNPQAAQQADNQRRGIVTQSWAPLGKTVVSTPPTLVEIGERHGKSPVQVVLRWHLEQGLVTFPKSAHTDRLRANLDIFDFTLTAQDMQDIAALSNGTKLYGQDPRVWEEF